METQITFLRDAILSVQRSNVYAWAKVVMTGWCALSLSNTSCLTQVTDNHKSQCVKVFQKHFLLVKLKTVRKSTGYQYLKKSLSLSFSLLLFPLADFYNRIDSLSLPLQDSGCFLCFHLKFYAGNWSTAGKSWSPRACPTFDRCVLCLRFSESIQYFNPHQSSNYDYQCNSDYR